jgi:N-acetylglucosaminyldiphosphoundecaprenol N-acetyl-beta-D-mannosaminyltransferase
MTEVRVYENLMATQISRVSILGVPVDVVDWPTSLAAVTALVQREGPPATVIAINPEKVMAAGKDARLLAQISAAGLLIPDGVGVVWAARYLGLGRMERVPGSEMMPAICALAASRGYKVFLFGAKEETNARCAEVLHTSYPGLLLAGRQNGYVDDEAMPALIATINASGADILFVALGSPRQELWMERYLPQLRIKVCQGVGGTFDVIAGNVKRAPGLFRALNLEWFYRLVTNPGRAARQKVLPVFVWRVLKSKWLPKP